MTFNEGKYGDFLISTTDTLEGYEILQYFDAVSSRIVVGAGFITEFFASITDTFGGRSSAVEVNLDKLYSDAMRELANDARRKGANAILGTRLDIDQISGKGTFMFMISAMGTPVYAQRKEGLLLYEEQLAAEKAHREALRAEAEARAEQERKEKEAEWDAYWEAHVEEKAQLEEEKRKLKEEISILTKKHGSHPGDKRQGELWAEIRALREEQDSLGSFKKAEKMAIGEKINKLREEHDRISAQTKEEKSAIWGEIEEKKSRLAEIEQTLPSKDEKQEKAWWL